MVIHKANNLIKVDPRNTSKTCSNCQKIHVNMDLSVREMNCGLILDRDVNAAINILNRHSPGKLAPIASGLITEEAPTL